ncbi:AraC family ethanolamine operon transcriptional activator [Inquilinus ginsengisoli]|uniref:helix-turn-helix domain-containing protein n=1 Tax=Inquilinus ginsengisoli TaxID=363840 RepID=UPI003D2286CF
MPEVVYTRRDYTDACAQEGALLGWQQRYAQLNPGPYRGAVEMLRLAGVCLWRERVSVAVEEATAAPDGQVVFVRALADRNTYRMNAVPVGSGEVLVMRGGEELHASLAPDSDILIVSVEAEKVFGASALQAPALAAPTFPDMEATTQWLVGLMVLFSSAMALPGEDLARLLPELIADKLGFLYAQILHRTRGTRPLRSGDHRLYRRAREIVDDQPDEPIGVTQLARRLGVSSEILRSAFKETVGVGPGLWLRLKRLDGARRDLLAADGSDRTVSDIAMKWGFWHLGRFSAYYAALYGESPSRTVRSRG